MRRGERMKEQRGYTFVAVLALIAITSLGLAVAGPIWSDHVRRDRELEMLRIGALYANAITNYRDRAPGSLKQYPLRLEDLLSDSRFVGVERHLRELYRDPVNQYQAWKPVRDIDARIIGVQSARDSAPIAERTIDLGTLRLAPARRYSDWKFLARDAS